MTINIPLLTEVMVHVRRNPEEWDQDCWGLKRPHCGTVHCIAGWAAQKSGAKIIWAGSSERATTSYVYSENGEQLLSVYAQEKLGLSDAEARSIFAASNDTAWRQIELITEGEITMAKIDAIIAEQDAARHRSDDPDRTGDDDGETDSQDDEEPRAEIRKLVLT